MLKTHNLKLYRKFLILAVMTVSIGILSYARPVAASVCCDNCMATYEDGLEWCYNPSIPPDKFDDCLLFYSNLYESCSRACGNGIPVCPAV